LTFSPFFVVTSFILPALAKEMAVALREDQSSFTSWPVVNLGAFEDDMFLDDAMIDLCLLMDKLCRRQANGCWNGHGGGPNHSTSKSFSQTVTFGGE
jgi:hypothetical protein